MSIIDPLEISMWHEYYIVIKGRETFYDENNALIIFDTEKEAQEWINDRKVIKGHSTRKTKRG